MRQVRSITVGEELYRRKNNLLAVQSQYLNCECAQIEIKKRLEENEHILTFTHAVMGRRTAAATAERLIQAPFIEGIDSRWIPFNGKKNEKFGNLRQSYGAFVTGIVWCEGGGDNQRLKNNCLSLQGAIATVPPPTVSFLCFFPRDLSIECFNDCHQA